MTLVFDNDRIVAIEAGLKTPSADDVIDWCDGTLMPGFIDMHTHLSSQNGPGSYREPFTLNPADIALRGAFFAKKTLMCLVTIDWG